MRSRIKIIWSTLLVFFICFSFLYAAAFAQSQEIPELEPFSAQDRVLILAPHPDDEDIGCGGLIQRALKSGAQVKVTYLTCGDNNIFAIVFYNKLLFPLRLLFLKNKDFVDLGHQRVHEAINAMKILGLKESDLIFLGYPDHGTDQMFIANWDNEKPYRSSFSGHSNVPYKESVGYKKGYTADNVVEDVKSVILSFKPTKVFVSSSSDVNGDHWAYYLYLLTSLSDLGQKVPKPKIYPYLVHAPGWPRPHNYHPELMINPPKDFFGDVLPIINWRQLKLTSQEIEKKYQAMKAYDTQMRVSDFYLNAFVRQNELFGDFPVITLKKQYSVKPSDQSAKEIVFTSDMQWTAYAVVDDVFCVKFKKPKNVKQRLSFFIGIFGYRSDVPFARMPNILVRSMYNHYKIYEGTEDNYISLDGTSLEFQPEAVIFKIPMRVLGDPEGLLFSFETSAKYVPLGATSFRVIKIEK